MRVLRDGFLAGLQVIGQCFTLDLPPLLCSLILPVGGLALVTVVPTRVPCQILFGGLVSHHEHGRSLSLSIYALVGVFKSQV